MERLSTQTMVPQLIESEETSEYFAESRMQIILVLETSSTDQLLLIFPNLDVKISRLCRRTTRVLIQEKNTIAILRKMLVGVFPAIYTALRHSLAHTRFQVHHLGPPEMVCERLIPIPFIYSAKD